MRDVDPREAQSLWDFSLKDVVHKSLLLPIFLAPDQLDRQEVRDLLSARLCARLAERICAIRRETRLLDYTPIHSYKTPCYRLYFEFAEPLCARLAARLDPRFGAAPALPPALAAVRARRDEEEWRRFVYYFCEDRESAAAHDYFGTGVF